MEQEEQGINRKGELSPKNRNTRGHDNCPTSTVEGPAGALQAVFLILGFLSPFVFHTFLLKGDKFILSWSDKHLGL